MADSPKPHHPQQPPKKHAASAPGEGAAEKTEAADGAFGDSMDEPKSKVQQIIETKKIQHDRAHTRGQKARGHKPPPPPKKPTQSQAPQAPAATSKATLVRDVSPPQQAPTKTEEGAVQRKQPPKAETDRPSRADAPTANEAKEGAASMHLPRIRTYHSDVAAVMKQQGANADEQFALRKQKEKEQAAALKAAEEKRREEAQAKAEEAARQEEERRNNARVRRSEEALRRTQEQEKVQRAQEEAVAQKRAVDETRTVATGIERAGAQNVRAREELERVAAERARMDELRRAAEKEQARIAEKQKTQEARAEEERKREEDVRAKEAEAVRMREEQKREREEARRREAERQARKAAALKAVEEKRREEAQAKAEEAARQEEERRNNARVQAERDRAVAAEIERARQEIARRDALARQSQTTTRVEEARINTPRRDSEAEAFSAFQERRLQEERVRRQLRHEETRKTRWSVIAVIVSVLLLLGGGGALFVVLVLLNREPAPAQTFISPPLIFSEGQRELLLAPPQTGSLREELARAIEGIATEANIITDLHITEPESGTLTDDTPRPVPMTTERFFEAIGAGAPPALVRSFELEFMFGVHIRGNAKTPFLFIPLSSFEHAFAGMFSWERGMQSALAGILHAPRASSGKNAGTTAPPSRGANPTGVPFEDLIVNNKDTRILRDASGDTVLLYGFPDRDTLIITSDAETFAEVVARQNTIR